MVTYSFHSDERNLARVPQRQNPRFFPSPKETQACDFRLLEMFAEEADFGCVPWYDPDQDPDQDQ